MQADLGRVSPAIKVASAGAVLLVLSLFLPWYGLSVSGPLAGTLDGLDTTASGWEALELIDVLLFLAALVVVGIAAAQALGQALPFPAGRAVLGAGLFALVLVIYRLIDSPGPSIPSFAEAAGIDVGRRFGVFVALVAAAVMVYGGARAGAAETPPASGIEPPGSSQEPQATSEGPGPTAATS